MLGSCEASAWTAMGMNDDGYMSRIFLENARNGRQKGVGRHERKVYFSESGISR